MTTTAPSKTRPQAHHVDPLLIRSNELRVAEIFQIIGGAVTGLAFVYDLHDVAAILILLADTDPLWVPTDPERSADDGGDAAFRALFSVGTPEDYRIAVVLWAMIRALGKLAPADLIRTAVAAHAYNMTPPEIRRP